ncbi:hypothetical protein [Streptomyces sp. NPDC054786]
MSWFEARRFAAASPRQFDQLPLTLVVVAMFRVGRPARDRLIMLLARVSLRPGQVAGLRHCDLHLLVDSRSLGCDTEGPHRQVIRRQNINGAWSKTRKPWVTPVDFLVVRAATLRHHMASHDVGWRGLAPSGVTWCRPAPFHVPKAK